MSSQMKGLVSIIFGCLAIFSRVVVEIINVTPYLLFTRIIPLILGIFVIYLGLKARKEGAKLLGLAGVVLGIVATVAHIFRVLEFLR